MSKLYNITIKFISVFYLFKFSILNNVSKVENIFRFRTDYGPVILSWRWYHYGWAANMHRWHVDRVESDSMICAVEMFCVLYA